MGIDKRELIAYLVMAIVFGVLLTAYQHFA